MAGEIARDRGVLLLRHQRPDADHLRHQPRRCRELPRHLYRQGHPRDRSVHLGRSRRRRRTGQDRRGSAAARRGPTSRSASAASTAAIPPRWRSATRSGSTMSRARPTACRSRGSPRRRPRSARPSPARRSQRCLDVMSEQAQRNPQCRQSGHCIARLTDRTAAKIRCRREISSSFSLTGYLPFSSSPHLPTFSMHCANRSEVLPVSRAQRRLTPRQPKFDTTKKGRIARMYCRRS